MNDEEVKQLLRELAEKADKTGKSEKVRIVFDRKKPEPAGEDRERPSGRKRTADRSSESPASEEAPENENLPEEKTAGEETSAFSADTDEQGRPLPMLQGVPDDEPDETDPDYYLDDEDSSSDDWSDFNILPPDDGMSAGRAGGNSASQEPHPEEASDAADKNEGKSAGASISAAFGGLKNRLSGLFAGRRAENADSRKTESGRGTGTAENGLKTGAETEAAGSDRNTDTETETAGPGRVETSWPEDNEEAEISAMSDERPAAEENQETGALSKAEKASGNASRNEKFPENGDLQNEDLPENERNAGAGETDLPGEEDLSGTERAVGAGEPAGETDLSGIGNLSGEEDLSADEVSDADEDLSGEPGRPGGHESSGDGAEFPRRRTPEERRKNRVIPVEPADFESDADDFRSGTSTGKRARKAAGSGRDEKTGQEGRLKKKKAGSSLFAGIFRKKSDKSELEDDQIFEESVFEDDLDSMSSENALQQKKDRAAVDRIFRSAGAGTEGADIESGTAGPGEGGTETGTAGQGEGAAASSGAVGQDEGAAASGTTERNESEAASDAAGKSEGETASGTSGKGEGAAASGTAGRDEGEAASGTTERNESEEASGAAGKSEGETASGTSEKGEGESASGTSGKGGDEPASGSAGPGRGSTEKSHAAGSLSSFRGRDKIKWIIPAAVAALAVIMIIISVVSKRSQEAEMARNVTADQGLTVLVKEEPETWVKSGDVTLDIRAESAIQSVAVNGEDVDFSGDKSTEITVSADTGTLSVAVTLQDKVLNAGVTLEKIDSEAPKLTIGSEGDLTALTAEDDKSGIEAIYYGELEKFSNVPLFKRYTEPFEADPDKYYVCFAVDRAGNISSVEETKLVLATALKLSEDTIDLFQGETAQLGLTTEPADAYTNGLTITNSNEEAVSVDKDGLITALDNGTAEITASADGLDPVTCTVNVQNTANITISAIGDLTLGTDENFSAQTSFDTVCESNGQSYFFDNVRDILSADDLTFGNLEGVLSTGGTRREDRTYCFRGDPSYTGILNDGSVEAVTLANNHSHDYGDDAFEDTKSNLESAGIIWVDGTTVSVKKINGVEVGLIGIYTLDRETEAQTELSQAIQEARDQGANIIIVYFHWGTEAATELTEAQQSLGHLAVDEGADLVLGAHPHVLQGIELYNGKYIVYSLGNFCFGGNSNPSDLNTMIFQETFTVGQGGDVQSTSINIVPCSISSSETWNNYQPTPLEGEAAQAVLTKIESLSEALGTTLDLSSDSGEQ